MFTPKSFTTFETGNGPNEAVTQNPESAYNNSRYNFSVNHTFLKRNTSSSDNSPNTHNNPHTNSQRHKDERQSTVSKKHSLVNGNQSGKDNE